MCAKYLRCGAVIRIVMNETHTHMCMCFSVRFVIAMVWDRTRNNVSTRNRWNSFPFLFENVFNATHTMYNRPYVFQTWLNIFDFSFHSLITNKIEDENRLNSRCILKIYQNVGLHDAISTFERPIMSHMVCALRPLFRDLNIWFFFLLSRLKSHICRHWKFKARDKVIRNILVAEHKISHLNRNSSKREHLIMYIHWRHQSI